MKEERYITYLITVDTGSADTVVVQILSRSKKEEKRIVLNFGSLK